SGALRTSYRTRDTGSTARQPSSSSSIEKPLMGALSPRWERAACSAFCQESASRKSDSLSLLPRDVTSTSQRMFLLRLCSDPLSAGHLDGQRDVTLFRAFVT